MAISLSDVQTTWGGANPIGLNEYYQNGSLIGFGVDGGSIPQTGAITLSNFIGANNQKNYSRNSYLNGDQTNDGLGYSLDYYFRNGKYGLTFNFGAVSNSYSPSAAGLTFLNDLSTWGLVYSITLDTIGQTYSTINNNFYIQGDTGWKNNFPGGYIVQATLNSNRTVTLDYNSGGNSGDAGSRYALARQRDAWITIFGSYSTTLSF